MVLSLLLRHRRTTLVSIWRFFVVDRVGGRDGFVPAVRLRTLRRVESRRCFFSSLTEPPRLAGNTEVSC
jgi:hypothetical protein